MSAFIFFVQQMLLFVAPLVVAAIGGMFCERSGIINIGVEGMMIIGAFCGCMYLHFVPATLPAQIHLLVALLISGIGGILFGLLHGLASINFNANQAISGIALNIAAPAISIYVARLVIGKQQISFDNIFRIEAVPILSKIPIIGEMLFQDVYIFTYLAVLIVIIGSVLLNKTRFGLRLKACGEYPQAADSVGINVPKMRYCGVLIGGFLAGMAGLMLTIPTSTEFSGSVAGFGFLAVSVVVFGRWKPSGIVLASFFFGITKTLVAAYTIVPILKDLNLDTFAYRMIPFIATLIVLALSSKGAQGPAAAGEPYDKSAR